MPSEVISPTLSLVTSRTQIYDGPNISRLGCCGISEMRFEDLQSSNWDQWSDLQWKRIISKTIKRSVLDKRLLVVGIPVNLGANSQYNKEFYTKLRKILKELGFWETKPYKNRNSGNTIVAMIGQVP